MVVITQQTIKREKFRRQHAITSYVVDFYCHDCKVAIELDGNFHNDPDTQEYDKTRTALLNEVGVTVSRFWDDDVLNNSDKILRKISEYLK